MPIIQQENGVKSVKGLPARWGQRAYRELKAELARGHEAAEPAEIPYTGPAIFVGPLPRVPSRYNRFCALMDQVTNAPLPVDATDAQLCILAETYANDCASNAATIHDEAVLRERMAFICRLRGLTPPDCKDDKQAILRCIDAAWWRRNLRKLHGRAFEAVAIRLGFVSIRAGAYASNETVARRRGQVERNKAALASVKMVNEHGAEFGLDELAAKGTSNKRIRRGELMLRLAGCEDVAIEAGHVGVFITLTAPSKYHAVIQKSGAINPKYTGAVPRQVQTYLQKTWSRIRAAYGRYSIKPYGFRIAEPHHDGCVHWHALVFMRPCEVGYFCALVERYALAEDGDEPGAQAQRVKFEMIDSAKGSAAAYIAKYISKNIDDDDDNHDEIVDEAGNVVKLAVDKASARVDAWAGVWGIRQFQPIGQPPVTVWRELRRVAEGEVKDAPANVRAAWDAAQRIETTDDDGVVTVERVASFGNYIRAQGGVCMGRDYAIAIKEEQGAINGRYGQSLGWAPVGIYSRCTPDAVYTSTRYTWTRKVTGVDLRRSWSPVNNCTQPHWAEGAMPGEIVTEFDDAWFDSDEYQKFFVPPEVVAAEMIAAEVASVETRRNTVWYEPRGICDD
jgi:hypothetical protein